MLTKDNIKALSRLRIPLSDAEYDIWVAVFAAHYEYCRDIRDSIFIADFAIDGLRVV
jgi:hypothetical protein